VSIISIVKKYFLIFILITAIFGIAGGFTKEEKGRYKELGCKTVSEKVTPTTSADYQYLPPVLQQWQKTPMPDWSLTKDQCISYGGKWNSTKTSFTPCRWNQNDDRAIRLCTETKYTPDIQAIAVYFLSVILILIIIQRISKEKK